ncbi:MAG: L-threonylcarbamoyladenylate synthase [bacterium]|nr:L-threonylcarbamoyladenylate synthase [bacterium]
MGARTRDPDEAARCLAAGGVVLMPTDTLPGLHARADAPAAVARIAVLKGRDEGKPLLVLCADTADARGLVGALAWRVWDYVGRCWPGPFTLVLPAGPAAPTAATRGGPTLAVRVPSPPQLRALITASGGALISTSANMAGEPPATDLASAALQFADGVDLVADLDWGGSPGDAASAMLDLTVWPPRVLRPGPRVPPEWEFHRKNV